MNRSYSRFVPHSRPAQFRCYVSSDRYATHVRPTTVNRPVYQQRVRRPVSQVRQPRRSYWFPIATMMAAVLFAASAVIPGSIFDAFAAKDEGYSVGIESLPGCYTVTVTGNNSTGIELPGENAVKTVNSDGTVTFAIDLDEETNYAIESTAAILNVSFGDVEAADGEETNDEEDSSAEGDTPAEDEDEGEDEGEETTPKAGAAAIKSINLSDSGATSVDISKCTGLKSVSLAGNQSLTENAYSNITYGAQDNLVVELDTPEFEYVDKGEQGKGYLFDVVGAGDFEDLTATLYGNIPVVKEGTRFFISFDNLDATFAANNSNGAPESDIYITNSKQPGVTYSMHFHAGYVGEYMDPPSNASTDPATPATNDSQTADDPAGDDEQTPNVKLTIEEKSKSVIKDAYIENVSSVKPSELKIVAKTLSAADKKTFVAAIKKADKDFNEADPSQIYNIYVVDSKGNKVDIKGKAAVTATIAYPSYAVEYLKDEYGFTIYHQLADKSIDKSITASPVKEGIQFTTDSFSNFAVSCSKKAQNYSDLVIHDDSKKIITSAKAHEGTTFSVTEEGYADTTFSAGETWIIAEAPTAEEEKDFFDAIKKVNKDFNEKDSNLIVYKVSLRNIQIDQPSYMSENGKVDFTLVYPNDTLKKNYSQYDFTVYHQLADKSIDTKQLAVGGKDGITVTTDGFSMFAVAPSKSTVPKTGESNVSANIALLLAMLSMMSFAGVYAKNRAYMY